MAQSKTIACAWWVTANVAAAAASLITLMFLSSTSRVQQKVGNNRSKCEYRNHFGIRGVLKHDMRTRIAALGALALAAVAFAASPVGNYSGKIVLDKSKLPKGQNAQQQKMIDDGIAQVAKMKVDLAIKSNKTFNITMSGGPLSKPSTAEGTWSQSGNTVNLKTTKQDGKKVEGKAGQTQTMTMSKDGKTLTLDGASQGMPGKMVFTRK